MSTSLFGEYQALPSNDTIRRELIDQSYAHIPFEMGRTACQELFGNFTDFIALCKQPGGDQLRKSLNYAVHDLGNGSYHFEYRRPGEINRNEPERADVPGTDHKYIFHYGPQTIPRAKEELNGALPKEMQVLLDNCDEFYEAATKVLRIGAKALGLEKVMFSPVRTENVHHLRLLDYVASNLPKIGEIHFDRSAVSAALSESSSGLMGAGGQNGYLEPISIEYLEQLQHSLKPIENEEYMAKFFAGAGFNRLPAHIRERIIKFNLLAHDINNDHPGESRQALVAFGNPHQRFTNYSAPLKTETSWPDIIKHIKNAA